MTLPITTHTLHRPRRPPALRSPRSRPAACSSSAPRWRRRNSRRWPTRSPTTTPSSPTTRAAIATSSIDDPEQDSTPELRADDVAAHPRRPGRRVRRRVRLQRRRGDRAGVGRQASRGGCARWSPTSRRCWSCCPTPPSSARTPRTSSRRSTPTGWRRPGSSSWSTPASTVGRADGAPPHAEPPEPSEQDLREAARFFDHELRPTTRTCPTSTR